MTALIVLLVFALMAAVYAAARTFGREPRVPTPWPMILQSTLAFALAFNVVFFVQELFLVWPKALTPGLEPTLFHNNHTWRGDHANVDLLQGTGALGTMLAGCLAWYWLVRHPPRRLDLRLLSFWLAVLGFVSALPQIVLGAAIYANDLGRAMRGLEFTPGARWTAAMAALIAMAAICSRLAPYLPGPGPGEEPASRARSGFCLAFLPALLAIPLIVPFRLPNHPLEVLLPPVIDALIAGAWVWAATVHVPAAGQPSPVSRSALALVLALLVWLAFFQLVLARGVTF